MICDNLQHVVGNVVMTKPMGQGDTNMNVRISEASDVALDSAADYFGMTKKEMLGRLLRWFAGQDRIIQAAVMGTLPVSERVNLPKLVLEQAAQQAPAGARVEPDPEQSHAEGLAAARQDKKAKRGRAG